jgi:hypothetical protein
MTLTQLIRSGDRYLKEEAKSLKCRKIEIDMASELFIQICMPNFNIFQAGRNS